MDSWLQRVAVPSWWTAYRRLRMATDCSGIGVPEIAMQMVGERIGGGVHHVWTCDISKPSQKWLQGLLGEHTLLADMMDRRYDASGAFTATDIEGFPHTFRMDDKIDVYVCPIFQRRARFARWLSHANTWDHEYADSNFWATLKTIRTVQPRSFVLENVKPIHSTHGTRGLDKALECLE